MVRITWHVNACLSVVVCWLVVLYVVAASPDWACVGIIISLILALYLFLRNVEFPQDQIFELYAFLLMIENPVGTERRISCFWMLLIRHYPCATCTFLILLLPGMCAVYALLGCAVFVFLGLLYYGLGYALCALSYFAYPMIVLPLKDHFNMCFRVPYHAVDNTLVWCVTMPGRRSATMTYCNLILGFYWLVFESGRMFGATHVRPVNVSRQLPWCAAPQIYYAGIAAVTAWSTGPSFLFVWAFCNAIAGSLGLTYSFLPSWMRSDFYMTYVGYCGLLDFSTLALSLLGARAAYFRFAELYFYIGLASTLGCVRFLVQFPGMLWDFTFGTDTISGRIRSVQHFPPWPALKPGAQVYRTGAFGFGWLTHHGVYVGEKDCLHYCIDVPKPKEFLILTPFSRISGVLIETWNQKHPDKRVDERDKVINILAAPYSNMNDAIKHGVVIDVNLQRVGHKKVKDKKVVFSMMDVLEHIGLQSSLDLSFSEWTVPRITSTSAWPKIDSGCHSPSTQARPPHFIRVGRCGALTGTSRDAPCEPRVGDLLVGLEEFDNAFKLTLRRLHIVDSTTERVIEMGGSPGNVSITGTSWGSFQTGLNASGSITSGGGLLPQVSSKTFIRRYMESSALGGLIPEVSSKQAVKKALDLEYRKVSYSMRCNCETFARWCALPTALPEDASFIGADSPQGEGLGSVVLSICVIIGAALCWLWRSMWMCAASICFVVLTAKLVHFYLVRGAPKSLETPFEDLELIRQNSAGSFEKAEAEQATPLTMSARLWS